MWGCNLRNAAIVLGLRCVEGMVVENSLASSCVRVFSRRVVDRWTGFQSDCCADLACRAQYGTTV